MQFRRYVTVLVLCMTGLAAGCRDNPVAPTTGLSLNDLAGRTSGPPGADVGNRVLFPQDPERPSR